MEAFLIYLLKASGILVIFYLVYYFLLRKDTFFTINRHFLIIGIISSLSLPFVEFTHIEFVNIQNPNILGDYTVIPSTQNTSSIINWWYLAFIIYSAGVLLLSIRFGLQLLSLKRLLLNGRKQKDGGFYLIKTSEDVAPFSFFKSIVYNPSLHSDHELEMIIKHEKTHAVQHHTIDVLIANLLHVFQWINPIAWIYKKSLEQNLEFIADRETVDIVQSKKEYQLTLVKVSSNNYSSITNNFYQSLIKKRIVMLNKQTSERKNLWKLFLILPLISLFLWSFNTKEITKFQPGESTDSNEYVFSSSKAQSNTIEFIVNKNSSKEDLQKIKKIFKNEYQVDIKFGKIERNNANEITGISIDISSENSKTNYAVQHDEHPIAALAISYNSKKDKINISQSNHKSTFVVGNGGEKSGKRTEIIEIHPDNDENHEFIFIGDDANTKIIRKKDKNGKVIIEEIHENDSDNVFDIHTNDNKTFAFITGNSGKEPLIIIDGKEVSKKEMKALDSKNIETMNVLKGEKAIKKYGEKAKNGVIEIITKKK